MSTWSVPGYSELEELGAGAQGRVVLARSEHTAALVAIKYLATGLLGDTRARGWFRDEARLLAQVTSPHVVQLFDLVETDEGIAIVLEAVRGSSLRDLLTEQSPLAPEAALAVLKGSLLGLAAAHSVGVIHRDYKPANVIVRDDGQSKLIDFGVARLTGQGDVSGTPGYMSPEQWLGSPASPATDVYAATCVFFECVTGERPFNGDLDALQFAHLETPVPLDGLPEPLRPLVARGMAKSPAERAWDTEAFVAELESVATTTYGNDWERQGLIALGAAAAALVASLPVALLSGTILGGGAVGGSTGSAAAQMATMGGKGALAKIGGAKGATAIGAAGVAAIVAGALLWPAGAKAGGVSNGSFRAYFTQPGVLLRQPNMPPAETPQANVSVTVAPARAKPGMTVRVTTRIRIILRQGVKYLPGGTRQCFGEKGKRPGGNAAYYFEVGSTPTDAKGDKGAVWFYPTKSVRKNRLPVDNGIYVLGKVRETENHQPYVFAECGFTVTLGEVREFVLPDTDELPPGHYMITGHGPPRFTTTKRSGAVIPPESAGARAEGTLPILTILEG